MTPPCARPISAPTTIMASNAEHLKKFKPKGGTICLQLGNVAPHTCCPRTPIRSRKKARSLKGEMAGRKSRCRFTNDQADLANQQMADTFTANPKLDAFILEGGWAQFAPQAYAQVTNQVMTS